MHGERYSSANEQSLFSLLKTGSLDNEIREFSLA